MEFRNRIRTAAKERGFRSEQAFILAACENELGRGDSNEATTQLEARLAATLANLSREVQALFALAHSQFAITNSLLQYVLTCMIEPPDDVLPAARARARLRYAKNPPPGRSGSRKVTRLLWSRSSTAGSRCEVDGRRRSVEACSWVGYIWYILASEWHGAWKERSPVAIRRNPGYDVFNVRLLISLDKLLREKRRYQGDLSASINDALLAVNLNTVKLLTLQGKKKQTARETQVVLLRRLIRRVKTIADARDCSVNQLVNSGLAAHYSKERTKKLGTPSGPTRLSAGATYDKMSPDERQQLVEALAGLAGLQEGPKDGFPGGTRYEYDFKRKRTFEVAPSGDRFPVALIAGKFRRDSTKMVADKTAR